MSDTIGDYLRAVDGFDELVGDLGPDDWDRPSMCTEWSVRDVLGHAVWGQRLTHGWATGQDYTGQGGAPGTPSPGRDELAGADPLETWRSARDATTRVLAPDVLARPKAEFGGMPLAGFVTLLTTDFLAHTFDIGHALGRDVRLAPELVPGAFAWARANIKRVPGFLGPELTPPEGADEQTRFLAYLGRRAW